MPRIKEWKYCTRCNARADKPCEHLQEAEEFWKKMREKQQAAKR